MMSLGAIAVSAGRRGGAIGALVVRYRYVLAAIDQIAISLLNFALTFSLVRLLSTTEFGTFSLWLAASNLALGVQSALACVPISVHAPAEADERKRHHLEEALANLNLLVVGLSMVAALAVVCISDADWAPKDAISIAAIPLFIGTSLYREYYKSIAFGRSDMVLLLAADAPYVVLTALGIGAMLVWPHKFGDLAGAFVALTAGGIAAQVFGALRLRRLRLRLLRKGWTEPCRKIFSDLSWSLAGVVSTHIHTRSYAYVATSLVGLARLASLNAILFLFRPTQILLAAWGRSATPEFSKLIANGRIEAVYRRTLAALAASAAGCAAWGLLLAFSWRLIEHYVLADRYPNGSALLLPWTITIILEFTVFITSTTLHAAREFRYIAWVMLLTAPITLAATAGLTLWHGYTWTMYGLAIGDGLVSALLLGRLYGVRCRLVDQVAAAAAASDAAVIS